MLSYKESKLLKQYRIRINGVINQSKIDGLKRGMFIGNVRQPVINLSVESTSNTMSWVSLSTLENSSKIIKNCLEHMHINVTRMICTAYGPYKLGSLGTGQAMALTLSPNILSLYRGTNKVKN
jgi:23S rRNA pseudouridine2605 synthase